MMPEMANEAKLANSDEVQPKMWSIWLYFIINGSTLTLAAK